MDAALRAWVDEAAVDHELIGSISAGGLKSGKLMVAVVIGFGDDPDSRKAAES